MVRQRLVAVWVLLLGVWVLSTGCGSDSTDGKVTDPQVHGRDPSAKECVVTLNGTSIPLRAIGSTDEDAVFFTADIGYQAGTPCTVLVTLNDRTATCRFTAPVSVYPVVDSPVHESGYAPGEPIRLAWHYDGDAPETVYVRMHHDEQDILYSRELPGTSLTHTIPGTFTADREGAGQLLITVDLGEAAWPFAGDLPAPGSVTATVLPGDAVTVIEGAENPVWSITVQADASALPADGSSSTTVVVEIQDQYGSPCANGTAVSFDVTPNFAGTVEPSVVHTSFGGATATFEAGTHPGAARVTATALGVSSHDEIELTEVVVCEITVGSGTHPVSSSPCLGQRPHPSNLASCTNSGWSLRQGAHSFAPSRLDAPIRGPSCGTSPGK